MGKTRIIAAVVALLLLAAAISLWLAQSRDDASSPRYAQIRRLIRSNLHLSGHLTWAVNRDTVQAVRAEVTVADIPVLIQLLSDDEHVVALGAQLVLQDFGPQALPALQAAAESPHAQTKQMAREAMGGMEGLEARD